MTTTTAPTPTRPNARPRLRDASRDEADHIARYDEWIRHQRYLGRMHVLNLIDDAWAKYGWIRPKTGRR